MATSGSVVGAVSIPLPAGEGGRVRIDELERLRAIAQEAVDEGGLPGPFRPGEKNESGHSLWIACSNGTTPTL